MTCPPSFVYNSNVNQGRLLQPSQWLVVSPCQGICWSSWRISWSSDSHPNTLPHAGPRGMLEGGVMYSGQDTRGLVTPTPSRLPAALEWQGVSGTQARLYKDASAEWGKYVCELYSITRKLSNHVYSSKFLSVKGMCPALSAASSTGKWRAASTGIFDLFPLVTSFAPQASYISIKSVCHAFCTIKLQQSSGTWKRDIIFLCTFLGVLTTCSLFLVYEH